MSGDELARVGNALVLSLCVVESDCWVVEPGVDCRPNPSKGGSGFDCGTAVANIGTGKLCESRLVLPNPKKASDGEPRLDNWVWKGSKEMFGSVIDGNVKDVSM